MRLLDMLRTEAPRPCFGDPPYEMPDWLWDKSTEVFEITEVANFAYAMSDRPRFARAVKQEGARAVDPLTGDELLGTNTLEFLGIDGDAIQVIRPPFDGMWMEFQAPENFMLRRTDMGGKPMPLGKVGCLMAWMDLTVERNASNLASLKRTLTNQYRWFGARIDTEAITGMLMMQAFAHKPGGGIVGPCATWIIPADEQGRVLRVERDPDSTVPPERTKVIEGDPAWVIKAPKSAYRHDDWLANSFATQVGGIICVPALLALGILHTREDAEKTWSAERVVPEGRIRVSKRVLEPMVTYKVLKIGPLRAQMAASGHESLRQVMLALHRVRGHYKHYKRSFHGSTLHPRNGQPLSEENQFVVWCPDFERGSAKVGRRDKDYSVAAGNED